MPTVRTRDGVNLHVKEAGAGRPVLLIHGWPLTGDMWEWQTLALLEAGYRVITYDRRGFGQSAHPASGYDYDSFADDLAAVIDEGDLRDVTLVGFSMGGGEIARYLSRHGAGRIRQAALVASVVPYVLKTDDNPHGVPGEKLDEMRQRVREDRFGFLQDLGKQLYGVGLVSHPVSQGVLDWTFMLALMASPKATLDCIDAFGRTDFRPDLPAFTVPTLVVHGTSDATVPIDATGRAAAKGIPGASLIEYEGQPHGLFATAADRLTSDLLNFLSI